ncbi:MAG: DUF2341 domain-containing protein, partial [Candidatus Thorarchaeota archaeon]|nr:DUF2341 domain-containing protein [Candidatus Thorarchaeota archaeon]
MIKSSIRILQISTIFIVFLLLVPLQTPFTDPEFVDPSRIERASKDSYSLSQSGTFTGTGEPLDISYSGTVTNVYGDPLAIDSSSSISTSVTIDDGWTASNPQATIESLSVDVDSELQNNLLDDYHYEVFLSSSLPSSGLPVPDYWMLTKSGDSGGTHPRSGIFRFYNTEGAGYDSSMGWQFRADWGTDVTLSSSDEIYLSQRLTLPYQDVYSAEVTFRYYVVSGAALDDLAFLFTRFGGTTSEFHVFESGDATVTWLQASMTVSNAVIQSLLTPGTAMLEIGLATDESGLTVTAVNHRIYVDDIEITFNVKPFAEQIDMAANGTAIQSSTYDSVHPYLPDDGTDRSAYDDTSNGVDLDGSPWGSPGEIDVGIWGSYITTDVFEVGLQFPIEIPQGAAIVNAYLEVESAGTDAAPDMRILIADEDNVTSFQTGLPHLEDLYTYVDYGVDWEVATWTTDVRYTSPNIAPLIQEIVTRSGWTSGNYISLMLDYMYSSADSTANNTIKGDAVYDDSTTDHNMPRLHIEYIVPSAADVISILEHSKPITISSSITSSDLTNFPVMIDIVDTDLKNDVQSDGDDIAFSIDGTPLLHEIQLFDQSYSGSEAHLIAWVKVPTISSSSDTTITMHYGNPEVGSIEDPYGVWNDFEAVYHLDSDPTVGGVVDSTINDHDGTALNMESVDATTGMIGSAYDFDGSNERVAVGPIDSNSWTQITLSGWIYADDTLGDDRLIAKEEGTGSGPHIFMLGYDHSQIKFRLYTDGVSGALTDITTSSLPTGSWSYIALTFDAAIATEVTAYINGSSIGSWNNNGTTIRDSGVDVFLGDNQAGNRQFDGRGDELRIASVARSADWLLAEYRNQYDPSTYITVGSEITHSSSWIDESVVYLDFTTTSTNLVSADILFTLDITGTGQSLDESYTPGASFYSSNGSHIVEWLAYAMISPPNTTSALDAFIDYPMTQWNPVAVANPLGQNKTYGTDWDFQGGTITVYSDAIDYWGVWEFYFESWNYVENLQVGINGQSLGNTATFDINDIAAFRASSPWITNAQVGLTLTDPTGAVWHTESATTGTPVTTWHVPSFQYRMLLTVSSSQVDADVTNYPLFLSFSDADFQNTSKVQADGDDFVFVQNDIILDHEIERFEQSTGYLTAWAKTNLSSSIDNTIWLYYGNPVVGSTESPANLWSNDFDAVYHMNQDVTNEGSGEAIYDSSANNYTGTHNGNSRNTGLGFSWGQYFDGNDWISVDATKGFDPSGDVTISGWFYLPSAFGSSSTTSMMLVEKYLSGDDNFHIALAGTDYTETGFTSYGSLVFGVETTNGEHLTYSSKTGWASGWHHFACVLDADTPSNNKVYADGADVTIVSGGASYAVIPSGADWGFGGRYAETFEFPTGEAYLTGNMDEIRISSDIKASGWMLVEYDNLNPSNFGSFVTEGAKETKTPSELTITETIDSTAIAGLWTATMNYTDSGSSVTNATGVYERNFIVQHNSTLTLNFPADAVSDNIAYATAGDPVYIEYELTDDIGSAGITGSTVKINWTVSGALTEITLDDLGDGRYGKTVDTDDLETNQRWRIDVSSSHPYFNDANEYFELDLYHKSNMSYVDVDVTPTGFNVTATLVFMDSYSDLPITGATITYANDSAVTVDELGNGRYNVTIGTSTWSTGDYSEVFKATKSGAFVEDAYANVSFTIRKHYTTVSVIGDLITPHGYDTNVSIVLIDTDTGGTISVGNVASWTFTPDGTPINTPADYDETLATSGWSVGTQPVTLSVSLAGSDYYDPAIYSFDIVIRNHYTAISVIGDLVTPFGQTTDVTILLIDLDTGGYLDDTYVSNFTFSPGGADLSPTDLDFTLATSGWSVGTPSITLSLVMGGVYDSPVNYVFDIEIRKHYTTVSVTGDLITPFGFTTDLTIVLIDQDTGTSVPVGDVFSFTFSPTGFDADGESSPITDYDFNLDTSGWSVTSVSTTLSVLMTGSDYFDPTSYVFNIIIREHYTAINVVGNTTVASGFDTPVAVVITDLDTGGTLSITPVSTLNFTWSGGFHEEDPATSLDVLLPTNTWPVGTRTVTLTISMAGSDYYDPDDVAFDIVVRKHYTVVSVSGDFITPHGNETTVSVSLVDRDTGQTIGISNVALWTFNPAAHKDVNETFLIGDFSVDLGTDTWGLGPDTVTFSVSMAGSIYFDPDDFVFNVTIRAHRTAISVTGGLYSPYGNTTDVTVIITDLDTGGTVAIGDVVSLNFTWSGGFYPEDPATTYSVTLPTASWPVGIRSVTLSASLFGSIYADPTNHVFVVTITPLAISLKNEASDLIFPTGDNFTIILQVNISQAGIYYREPVLGLGQAEFTVRNSSFTYTLLSIVELTDGRYNLTMDAQYFPEGFYTITVILNTVNSTLSDAQHIIVFSVRPARSDLTANLYTISTPYNSDANVTLTYTDLDRSEGITTGTITSIDATIEFTHLGNGVYEVSIDVSLFGLGSQTVNLTADASGYDARSVIITVIVTQIHTDTDTKDLSLDMPVGYTLIFFITYTDIDNNVPISGASVSHNWTGSVALDIIWSASDSAFRVNFTTTGTDTLGLYLIWFNFSNGPNYVPGYIEIEFDIRTHTTIFNLVSAVQPTAFNGIVNISLRYYDWDSKSGIDSAFVQDHVWNGTNWIATTLFNQNGGIYLIQIDASQFGLGIQTFDVFFNWTGPVQQYENKSIVVSVNIIGVSSELTLIENPDSTAFLYNMTYTILFSETDGGPGITNTSNPYGDGNVFIYVTFDDLSVDTSLVDIWEVDYITRPGQYQIQFNTSIFGRTGTNYMYLFINWSAGVQPGYTNRTDIISVKILTRSTIVSIVPATPTPWGENATFSFSYEDVTGELAELIQNSTSLEIALNVSDYTLTYDGVDRLFTVSFNTSQYAGSIGQKSITLTIIWYGSPYYTNQTNRIVRISVTSRITVLDYQSPPSTPYLDNTTFIITWTDVTSTVYGITGATIELYNGTTAIPGIYYNVTELTGGSYEIELASYYFDQPGAYSVNVTATQTLFYLDSATAIRTFTVLSRTTRLSADVVASVPYNFPIELTLFYQDVLTGIDIGNTSEDVSIEILNGTGWIFTSAWISSSGFYSISVETSNQVGLEVGTTYALEIRFSYTYQSPYYAYDDIFVYFTIRNRISSLERTESPIPTPYLDYVNFTVHFSDSDAGAGIDNADLYVYKGLTELVESTHWLSSPLGSGYYKIFVLTSALDGLGITAVTVFANWTLGSPYHDNATIVVNLNVINRVTNVEIVSPPLQTNFLENVTFVVSIIDLGTDQRISVTKSLIQVWNGVTQLSSSNYSLSEIGVTQTYTISIKSDILSSVLVINQNLTVRFDWSGSIPYYKDDSTSTKYTLIARSTYVSIDRPSNTAYGENATFTFGFIDSTTLPEVSIDFSATEMTIFTNLTETPEWIYNSGTGLFTMSFDTSQFGLTGLVAFHLNISWARTPYYSNKTMQTVFLTITYRQTQVDFQAPVPTPYGDNVSFTIWFLDISGLTETGIPDASLLLYYLGAQIPSENYVISPGGDGSFGVEFYTGYFSEPGTYYLNGSFSYAGAEFKEDAFAIRPLSVRYRTTILSADPVGSVGYETPFDIILYFQDQLTFADIGNSSTTFIEVLNDTGIPWVFTISWNGVLDQYEMSVETAGQTTLSVGITYTVHLNMSYANQAPFFYWDDVHVQFTIRSRTTT